MKRLIRFTTAQANKIRGMYKTVPMKECEPVKVEAGFYILHEGIKDVPELAKKLFFAGLPRFIIGDKSASDLKYAAHLKRQEAEIVKNQIGSP